MDSQLTEIIGKQRLVTELLGAGLEVAVPMRDRGIDLIVYADLQASEFLAIPIQMKAASKDCFAVDQKYRKFPNLLLVYVWHLEDSSKAVTYALTFPEAEDLAERMRYTKTPTYQKTGIYTTTQPSRRLLELMEPFKMTAEKWQQKISQQCTKLNEANSTNSVSENDEGLKVSPEDRADRFTWDAGDVIITPGDGPVLARFEGEDDASGNPTAGPEADGSCQPRPSPCGSGQDL